MKTYIYNTNFNLQNETEDSLITKESKVINNLQDDLVIVSEEGPQSYNTLHKITKPHTKGFFHGLLIKDIDDRILVDKHFPKTKALYVATMLEDNDILIMSDNGCYFNRNGFNNKLQTMPKDAFKELYTLNNIYMIYVKGDKRTNLIVKDYYTYYDEVNDWTIVSYGKLEPTNVLKFIKGYKVAISDNPIHIPLLNEVDEAMAIGQNFDIRQLKNSVEHVDRFYMINQYINLFL